MTLVIACKDDDGQVWMGTDLRSMIGDRQVTESEPKWLNLGGKALMGFCGFAGLSQYIKVWSMSLKKTERDNLDFETIESVYFFSEILKQILAEEGYTADTDSGGKGVLGEFIIASPTKMYHLFGGDFSVNEFENFVAIGSGEPYAEGAYYASSFFDDRPTPEQLIMLCIDAASEYSLGVGGHSPVVKVSEYLNANRRIGKSQGRERLGS